MNRNQRSNAPTVPPINTMNPSFRGPGPVHSNHGKAVPIQTHNAMNSRNTAAIPTTSQRPRIQNNVGQHIVRPVPSQQKKQSNVVNVHSVPGTIRATSSNPVSQPKKQVISKQVQNGQSLNPKMKGIKESVDHKQESKSLESVGSSADSKSTATMEEMQKLGYWGLPNDLVAGYDEKGITALYEWQVECMNNQEVLRGGNLVYSAPTGGGKTLVAEVLMLRNILRTKRKAVFVLPFVSIVVEKVRYFTKIFKRAKVMVKGFYSDKGGAGGLGRNCDIAICTIEKVRKSLLSMQYVIAPIAIPHFVA